MTSPAPRADPDFATLIELARAGAIVVLVLRPVASQRALDQVPAETLGEGLMLRLAATTAAPDK